MKNLFDPALAGDLKSRLQRLQSTAQRQWGTMNAAQMVAHCSAGLELAFGERRPPRKLIGRIIGPIVKPLALGDDKPMRRNSPTVQGMVMTEEHDLAAEKPRLATLIDRFVTAGPAACTTHPHAFFGRLTPDEWAVLMYKHIDHHLRQFGV